MKKNRCVWIAALLVWLLGPVQAIGADGDAFAEQKTIAGYTLTLRGSGVLRYMVFIKAYEGAFYLQAGKAASQALDERAARCLVLHYLHGIKAQDFAEATTEMIKKNVTADQFASLLPKIEKFNTFYRDVVPGDRYTAVYIPDGGTRLQLNDDFLGMVEGAEFASAFFAIWIGDNPIDKTFRDRMLGKRRP